jgi:hypothetical protein
MYIEQIHIEMGALPMGRTKAEKEHRMPGKKEQPTRTRVHRSIYLEQAIYDRLGEAYKTTSHELYPLEVRKSAFVEACIAYALDHLPDIKTALHKNS